ncbi:MAG TPA: glycosyltransferase [Hyphomicrobiaceae bacterium]|nr:glycosyltransferase [Hyphomicrobiaceae bacterium]
MKLVIFGLTISSSWGNGHATLWRGLVRALIRRGCRVTFFERDLPYYAANRDLNAITGGELVLYRDWPHVTSRARREITEADVAIVTSYCPDAIAATEMLAGLQKPLKVFYDLDTPVTLSRLSGGEDVSYIGPRGLADFELALSFTGGAALTELKRRLGAAFVAPLYGHVDPDVHHPTAPLPHYIADLSYLGTYAGDRQASLQALLITPAMRRPKRRFLIGGAEYPREFPWSSNIYFVRHLPPGEHAAFYSSSRLTLNITRAAMARMGWCPSGRLFEAAACGTALLSDRWEGLSAFYTEGSEILVAQSTEDAIAALDLSDAEIGRIARAGRERTLDEHTSGHRADQLIEILTAARSRSGVPREERIA